MVLGFQQYHDGKPTFFEQKILAGVNCELAQTFMPKLHTMRLGTRWKAGNKIHMATGVRTRGYRQFNTNIPELSVCKSVQDVEVRWKEGKFIYNHYDFRIFVNERELNPTEQIEFINNDGFELVFDFGQWFNKDFKGQLIHWTDLRY